ncbi:bifunctional demethylmenaquinone methyltransferase/2-methoxy-6-polyprenyl-1,4-benzoquinol methylase UbiE [Enhydrobacter aerosaccus]|nr:bifunctional demethylmenaquinone methyltransferase/2-methoxy-6-polyprenyl-1,4-benzoquinol methylase UbiE [Enhydrobacter aerosaccus]
MASFGYRDVPKAEKARMVRDVFESVAPRYDLMNDLMSGGVHRLWKNALVDTVNPRPGEKLLDVAGGTGDIAFRLLQRQAERGDVTVCDINPAMLGVGRDRAIDRGLLHGLTWATGDAERLPFPDRSFDVYTIAFGLRNVTDIDQALREAYRVLKPGGRYFCLEFSKVTSAPIGRIYDTYSERALPFFGRLVARDAESYRYLHESIRRFPPQRELAERMRAAGFERVSWRNMTFGVVALHSGWRI